MRLSYLSGLAIAVALVSGVSAQQGESPGKERKAVLPAKTEVFITLTSRISTKTAAAGDRFTAQTAVPVTLNDEIIIPVGSHILGRVARAQKAGRLRGKAELELEFQTVILPNGATRNFEAVLQSAEGQESGRLDETTGAIQGSGGQGAEAARGSVGGAATGAAIGAIAGRGWKGVGVGAVVGAAAGAVLGTTQRGPDIVLERGSQVTVTLLQAVALVKPEPATQKYTVRP